MTRETYLKVTEGLRKDPRKARQAKLCNRFLTGFVFLIYPLFLLALLLEKDPFLLRAILVPAISFVLVTVFRQIINAPRPYEKFEMAPVLEKDTKGKSFPSRHVFSVFIIAMTIFYLHHGAGLMLGLVGVGLGSIRVLGGVHEPKDVVVGALIGILCGIVGYYIL